MQQELDAFWERYNISKPRFNKHRAGPDGSPDNVFETPEHYDTSDFRVRICFLYDT